MCLEEIFESKGIIIIPACLFFCLD
ncbi:unnamed protein product [Victoria cruziana]